MVGYNVILFINYSSIQCRKTCFLGLWMQMRATMLPLKASTTSKDGTRLGEKHMMTYILWLGHIHIFFCGHGCDTLSFVTRMMYFFVYISPSIGNHSHIFGKQTTYISKRTMILSRWRDYITHEKTTNKLIIHNKRKRITFTLKESTNGSSSLGWGGVGLGGGEFFHSIILIFSSKIWGGYIGSVLYGL